MKFTLAYTLLLLYVISAIVFWGYSLNKQNKLIYQLEKEKWELMNNISHAKDYKQELNKLNEKKIRRTRQFLGEGSTFILVILMSATIVYYAYYRQQKLNTLQQNFMLSITHELKTPIAGIKLNMQTLQKRQLDAETQSKLIGSSVNETNRLDDLCNNILIATRLESSSKAAYTDEISILQLLNDTCKEFQSRFPDRGFVFVATTTDHILHGDYTLWKLVISNLLENARKYSPKNENIELNFYKEGKYHFIAVKDKGLGIPDEQKQKIFEKFYRVGNENTRTSKGTGLGLYLVKKIVKLYKYDITVKNNTPNGSIFEVRIT